MKTITIDYELYKQELQKEVEDGSSNMLKHMTKLYLEEKDFKASLIELLYEWSLSELAKEVENG